ncbi:hypothetical protein BKA70DRAFT_1442364 [Coprinopsis sp. MPI-PUGE-AT-0042]|nr:hypothetical protein BKA70DRAFT_1442364 [Coprinopsis sp. MPI-PUGE-AT-0042]
MTSTFTIKLKKTQASEAVEFELTDSTSGVQRQVDWGSAWGFDNFNYRTNSTAMDSSAGTSVLGGSTTTSTFTEHGTSSQSSKATASKL